MKKLLQIPVILALVLVSITSCSKDNTTNSGTTIPTSTILVQGTWKITYFKDGGTDGTANYNGYIFTFVSGGSVSIINGSIVYNGTWTTYNDDFQNKFFMDFGVTTSPIAELKKDWHIIEKTTTRLRMEDVSGGGSATSAMTLERI